MRSNKRNMAVEYGYSAQQATVTLATGLIARNRD